MSSPSFAEILVRAKRAAVDFAQAFGCPPEAARISPAAAAALFEALGVLRPVDVQALIDLARAPSLQDDAGKRGELIQETLWRMLRRVGLKASATGGGAADFVPPADEVSGEEKSDWSPGGDHQAPDHQTPGTQHSCPQFAWACAHTNNLVRQAVGLGVHPEVVECMANIALAEATRLSPPAATGDPAGQALFEAAICGGAACVCLRLQVETAIKSHRHFDRLLRKCRTLTYDALAQPSRN